MKLEEIKQAINEGKTVKWSNSLYTVKKYGNEYNIICSGNGYCIGLTWMDGVTMNGQEKDFYISND